MTEEEKKKIIRFIRRLAWHDIEFDALMSGIDMVGSRLAIPRYSKKYFDLWKKMFNEDLQEKGGAK